MPSSITNLSMDVYIKWMLPNLLYIGLYGGQDPAGLSSHVTVCLLARIRALFTLSTPVTQLTQVTSENMQSHGLSSQWPQWCCILPYYTGAVVNVNCHILVSYLEIQSEEIDWKSHLNLALIAYWNIKGITNKASALILAWYYSLTFDHITHQNIVWYLMILHT